MLGVPFLYAASLGPLIAAYKAGGIGVSTWLALTTVDGPYAPLVDYSVHGEGAFADAYRGWTFWWE